jgi:hypothetical protein
MMFSFLTKESKPVLLQSFRVNVSMSFDNDGDIFQEDHYTIHNVFSLCIQSFIEQCYS